MPEWEYAEGCIWGWADEPEEDPRLTPRQKADPRRKARPGRFRSPEEAAAPEIPPRYVRVVSVTYHPDGDRAVVELLTNEEPQVHPLTVGCVRDKHGFWYEDWSAG